MKKLNEMALANAFAALGFIFYAACFVIITTAPDLYKSIAQSWFHGVDLSQIWKGNQDNFLLGLITFTGSSWISGWLLAWFYNRFSK
ncbi:hypothetical protein HYS03_01805 [Candidatus Woesebacteria bacterium]|nr:hypothetical protein [Candidatus Woesebacteria bacterium]QQG47895.1 MAG: hypothetical protein HY044_02300 [Candidatus Woesebacteria bacterium]